MLQRPVSVGADEHRLGDRYAERLGLSGAVLDQVDALNAVAEFAIIAPDLFFIDGTDLSIVVREHDVLDTDLGPGRVDQNDSSPVFGGGPSINASGAVAFNCTLTPEDDDQVEWGSGVYVATPDLVCPEDLDGNGVVGFSDLTLLLSLYGTPCPKRPEPCVGDVTGDGERGFADLTALLAAWGPC